MNNKTYDANSIEVLKDLEPVRKNPSMYIGNVNTEGLHHLVYELIDNSTDEYLAGHCKQITVTIHPDGILSVEDDGRGIPVDTHKEGVSALEIVMTKLNAGGKFKKDSYQTSGGLHGLGASIVNALSEWCKVEVRRDGKVYCQEYERGKKKYDVKPIAKTKGTGTKTYFKPDKQIFNVLEFDFTTLANRLKERAYLNHELKLILNDLIKDKTEEFCFTGGIKQFVQELNSNVEVINDIIYIERQEKDFSFEIAFQYNRKYTEKVLTFANNINTVNGGVHLNGFKNALLKVIVEFIDKNKLLHDFSANVLPRDVSEGLVAVVNAKLKYPQFEGQTKTKLNNADLRIEIEETCKKELTAYFKKNETVCEQIISKIAETVRVRDAAAKAREMARKKSGRFESLGLPIKLTDCVSKEREKCEVFIVEGDSASSNCKSTRDKDYQAILSLKGKVLNVEGSSVNRILESQEIKNIISSLGIDIKNANNDKTGLRYGKIILMTDADVDGSHIVSLLLTLFYRYMRKVVEDGHLYIAKPPLYRVTFKNEVKYLDDEGQLEKYKQKYENILIQRFKGLGEMNAEQLYDTTMDMEKRKLEKITIEDAEEIEKTLNILMGDDPTERRKFIMENLDDKFIEV